MDQNFWIERWKIKDIGFHQPEFEPALDKFWSRMQLRPGARVFVLPNPSGRNANYTYAEMLGAFRQLRDSVDGIEEGAAQRLS